MQQIPKNQRIRTKSGILFAFATALLGSSPVCLTGTQFRAAALPAVHSGVSQILDGVVNGIFAAIAVEPDNSSGTPTSP